MADLMKSLLTSHSSQSSQSSQPQPLHPTSSNESFHSTGSQQPHPLPTSASKTHTQLPPTLNPGKGNLPIVDINAYLSDPANAALLASTNASSSSSTKHKAGHGNNDNPQNPPSSATTTTTSSSSTSSSIPLGTGTSHHVPLLNTLCQTKALPTPIYEIAPTGDGPDHDIRFGGCVRVGTEIVGSEQRWRNKKEAREGLAERAVPLVTAMAGRVRHPATTTTTTTTAAAAGESGIGSRNWVGLLQEYHNATYSGSQSPVYSYYQVEGRFFAATCAIPAALPGSRQFGSPTSAFASKKAAQGAAAREAVEALMAEGKIGADGVTTAGGRKKSKGNNGSGDGAAGAAGGGGGGGPCVRLTDAGLVVSKGGSFAQRVTDMAPLMGLPTPQYHIEPASAAAPNLLNAYVTFNGVPALQGPVGEARNVYGKKNAREEVAKGVWEVLKVLATSRGFEPEI